MLLEKAKIVRCCNIETGKSDPLTAIKILEQAEHVVEQVRFSITGLTA
jgi:hypothetical protein